MDTLTPAGPAPSRSVLAETGDPDDDDESRRGSTHSGSIATTAGSFGSPQHLHSNSGDTSGPGSRRGSKDSIGSVQSVDSNASASPRTSAAERRELTRRRNKAHVSVACYPCKRAHLACETGRPCKRCVNLNKADQCVDVAHKRRGRPRIKDAAGAEAAKQSGPPDKSLNYFQAVAPGAPGISPARARSDSQSDGTYRAGGQSSVSTARSVSMSAGQSHSSGDTTIGRGSSIPAPPTGWQDAYSQTYSRSYSNTPSAHAFSQANSRSVTPSSAALVLSMDLIIVRATDELAYLLGTQPLDLLHRPLAQLVMEHALPQVGTIHQALAQDAASALGVQPKIAQQLHPRALQDALARYSTPDLLATGSRPSPVHTMPLTLRTASGQPLQLTWSIWLGAYSAAAFPYAVLRAHAEPAISSGQHAPSRVAESGPYGHAQAYQPPPFSSRHPTASSTSQQHPRETLKQSQPVPAEQKTLSFLDPGFDWASATASASRRTSETQQQISNDQQNTEGTPSKKEDSGEEHKRGASLASVMN